MTAAGRRENPRLITGQGRYVSGLHPAGLLHCAFARSSIAHGVVEAVDTDTAGPGVTVLTAADLDRRPLRGRVPHLDNPAMVRPPLATDRVRYVGEPDGGGGLTVWCGHQAPHRLKAQLSRLLGIDRVRVIVPDVGGAFGLKGMLFPEYVVVAACALRTGRPVGWTETRTEHFLGGTHGRSMRHRIRLAGERSGRLRPPARSLVPPTSIPSPCGAPASSRRRSCPTARGPAPCTTAVTTPARSTGRSR